MLLKISDRLSLVISETGFTYCNCLFIDDDIRTIIDTGANRNSLEEIKPDSTDLVLYTHHHIDHVRGNTYFPQAQKYIHELDYPALENLEAIIHYNCVDRWTDLMPGYDFAESGAILGMGEEQYKGLEKVEHTFGDQHIFDLGHTRVQALHTPGHSPGHCVFWFPEEELVFSGDICLTKAGPWYGEVFANPGDMLSSIERVMELKPKKIVSCHTNRVYDDAIPRLTEFKNRIYKRDERIYKYLTSQAASLDEIADQNLIYLQHPTPFVLFWEKLMVLKHLDRLIEQGRVEEVEPGLYQAK